MRSRSSGSGAARRVTSTSPARVFVLFGADLRDLQASFPGVDAAEIEAEMETRIARD